MSSKKKSYTIPDVSIAVVRRDSVTGEMRQFAPKLGEEVKFEINSEGEIVIHAVGEDTCLVLSLEDEVGAFYEILGDKEKFRKALKNMRRRPEARWPEETDPGRN